LYQQKTGFYPIQLPVEKVYIPFHDCSGKMDKTWASAYFKAVFGKEIPPSAGVKTIPFKGRKG
jgi:hypothetical protein